MTVDTEVSDLISVDQAVALIDAVAAPQRLQSVHLGSAAGRVLAEDILADRDYPPFDKSLMDGYAVRSGDVAAVPATLKLVGEIGAGARPRRGIEAGETMAIMTGAPLPGGADAVVPVEYASRNGSTVTMQKSAAAGAAISRKGADRPAGGGVLERGTLIGPAQLAVAASVGAARLSTYRPPTAFVLATGDEVVSIRSRPGPVQIRNANNIMLCSLLSRLGADVTGESHVPDDRKRLRSAIERAMKHDLLFVSGGMSMGAYDYVPATLKSLGYDLRVTKVRIRPGKPFVFGVHEDGRFAFGLPGNPVSAFACTVRLAARLIRRMTGRPAEPRWISAPLAEAVGPNGPREFYQPAGWDDAAVRPLLWKGSADVFTLAAADVLLVRPENDPARPAGHAVRLLEVDR